MGLTAQAMEANESNYIRPGSNWRPSVCQAGVVAARPWVLEPQGREGCGCRCPATLATTLHAAAESGHKDVLTRVLSRAGRANYAFGVRATLRKNIL
jgi:hypothetical protein